MVTIDSATRIDSTTWEITWSSDLDGATFYLYLDGQLIYSGAATSYRLDVAAGDTPVIDVLDSAAAPPVAYPRYFTITWYSVVGSASYLIEELVGSTWTERASLTDDGRGYFVWASAALADATVHEFRVTALGVNGNLGTVAGLSCLMVRRPDPPTVAASYDPATGEVTFAGA